MTAGDDELAVRAAERVGTVLRGKYHLDRVLGIGGMAVVYAATHRNRKQFAVKVLNKELSFHADTRTRFLREGYVANSVGHPGSVAVLDDDVAEDGAAFLVMELLDGETVEELWERSRRRLSLDVVLRIGHQLLDVLAAAHVNGIVHRDVKPANVFLTRAGQLKVLDFGIARLRDVAVSHGTNSGILLGTPAFMAPEQAAANASEIDARTDVWAVGAMMYTLASGRLVHDGSNAIQVLMKAAQEPARSLGVFLPETPFKILHVIDRALAFDKSARWPSAAAMRDAITDATLRTTVSADDASSLDATIALRDRKNFAFAPTLASEPDVTQGQQDAALVSTEPGQDGAALPAFDELATPVDSSGNVPTRFAFVPTLGSARDVKRGEDDDASKASTEPGKKRAAPRAVEFDSSDETLVVGGVPSSDMPTRVQELDADVTVPGSGDAPTEVQRRPDARTATMTALSQSRDLTETMPGFRPPTRFGRQFLTPRFDEPSARFLHVIARSAWKVVPARLALLARRGDARTKLLTTSAVVLGLIVGSLTIFIGVKRFISPPRQESAPALSETATAPLISAPVETSETIAPASAASQTAPSNIVADDALPTPESRTPMVSVPASANRVKPTVPPAPHPSAAELRRQPAVAPAASTTRLKLTPPAPSSTHPAAVHPNCNPKYDIDALGTKIWKRECL